MSFAFATEAILVVAQHKGCHVDLERARLIRAFAGLEPELLWACSQTLHGSRALEITLLILSFLGLVWPWHVHLKSGLSSMSLSLIKYKLILARAFDSEPRPVPPSSCQFRYNSDLSSRAENTNLLPRVSVPFTGCQLKAPSPLTWVKKIIVLYRAYLLNCSMWPCPNN